MSKVPLQSKDHMEELIELLSDWYWEQDENYCFTVMKGKALRVAGVDPNGFLGTTRWGSGRIPVSDGGNWDRHKAELEARRPITDFVYKSAIANNELRYISVSGQPIFDQNGKFCGYRGIAKDISQQVRFGIRRDIEHAVMRILATSATITEALSKIIQAFCETLGWTCGMHWELDAPDGRLHCDATWGIASAVIEQFIKSEKHPLSPAHFANGAGQTAWINGEPVWVPNLVKDTKFPLAADAAQAGLHSGFAFSVKSGAQVIGVLTFFNQEMHRPDSHLLECVTYIGGQIGQFILFVRARQELVESEDRLRSLIELSSDWLWEQDEHFRATRSDKGLEKIVGMGVTSRLGKTRWDSPALNLTEKDWALHRAQLERHEPFYDFEIRRPDVDGKQCWVSISGRPIFDSAGIFKGYRGIGRDISARKITEERIQYLATRDSLTSLPNRSLFSEILNRAIHSARRYKRRFAVLFIDLDRFKLINDTLGHEAGDMLLKTMSIRLKECLRTSDILARLGGDEFVVLVQEVNEPRQVAIVANKILSSIIKPIVLMNQECRVTASIGICMYPSNAQDEQALMKNADVAMYQAKEEGRNNYQFYSENRKSQSLERLALETSLRHAVKRDQFFLHYQPIVDLEKGKISGVEALLRWQHPELGVVSPLQFIPLAEETGMIVEIGRWVLNTACAQNVAWQREGLPPLRIAVNLSARQFSDASLLDFIAAAVKESGMSPQLLELELTESMVIQDPERVIKLLAELKKMGVRLAIDDFGTGYSSLAQLKRFPIDTLKVDRSFIRDIPQDTEDKAITEAIIAMGKTLGLNIIAEGVETVEQVTFLRDHGCHEIQGFYFSKPIAPDAFSALWRKLDNKQSTILSLVTQR